MIKAIVMDVDGTLTDGKIYITNSGDEFKAFNIKDGQGIMVAHEKGLKVAIITGRTSHIVEKRAAELKIKHLYQGINNKIDALTLFSEETGISFNEIAYIGDDINDLECIKCCGLSGCPNDSDKEVIKASKYVSKKNGGEGAVRDFISYIVNK